MDEQDYRYGVIVRGHPSETRRVCIYAKAFETYLGADASSDYEAYLSAFTYPEAFCRHVEAVGFAKYDGPLWARYISLDFDNEKDPGAAIQSAQRLLHFIEVTANGDLDAVVVTYSGNKGCHVRLPIGGLLTEPRPDFPKVCKSFCALLAEAAGVSHLDTKIYDTSRLLRLPNTRHPKTGQLCVLILASDFVQMDPMAVINMGKGGRRDGQPLRAYDETWCDWTLQDYWNRAIDLVKPQTARRGDAEDFTDLNRQTLEFIREGAEIGERNNRLFQAAANLAEFGADERLTRALLIEAARDTGLPLREIESAIQAGVRSGGNIR